METTNIILNLPTQFAQFVDHIESVKFQGKKFIDLLNHLESHFGNIKERLVEEDESVRPYLNIYVNEKNIQALNGIDTIIPNGASVSILLSRAGG